MIGDSLVSSGIDSLDTLLNRGFPSNRTYMVRYLHNLGVTVVIPDKIQNLTGGFRAPDSHVSYLIYNIFSFRHIGVHGDVQNAAGVLKKRFGSFESTLRSFHIDSDGTYTGEPRENLRGVLTGTPTLEREK
jgi:circadian clock protein KaiC